MANRKNPHFGELKRDDPDGLRAIALKGALRNIALHGYPDPAKAIAGTRAKRMALVDPDGLLAPDELELRIKALEAEHMAMMREAMRRKKRDRLRAQAETLRAAADALDAS